MRREPRGCPTCGRPRVSLHPPCWEESLARETLPRLADTSVIHREPVDGMERLRFYLGTRFWRGELSREVLEEALASGVADAEAIVREFGPLLQTPFEEILERRGRAGWPPQPNRSGLFG